MRSILSIIVGQFDIGPDKIQIGVMSYDRVPTIEFVLDKYTDRKDVAEEIRDIEYRGGDHNFALAFLYARAMFSSVAGGRADACKVLVVVASCGGMHRAKRYALRQAEMTRSMGVKIIIVSLTSKCRRSMLRKFASEPTGETTLFFTSPGQMLAAADEMVDGACITVCAAPPAPAAATTTTAAAAPQPAATTTTAAQQPAAPTTTTTAPTTTTVP